MDIMELQNICYSYDGKNPVLKNVCCSFRQGVMYVITGKSGSGKSTLMSLMAGLDRPTSGQIVYEGQPMTAIDLDEYKKRCVSMIYQDFRLFPQLTVLENIMYPMELCRVDAATMRRDAEALAGTVSLSSKLFHRFPGGISGGEQQSVGIARALTMNRNTILADEPTGNLDSENSDQIIAILSRLVHEENRCVIMVTHDLSVMKKADVVYQLIDGTLRTL